uniref:non-specific protein-tyrosine kinase n=1 Tax=Panagrellus redivivus TaxID=6233 RepID=A0A7E4V142_PANRE
MNADSRVSDISNVENKAVVKAIQGDALFAGGTLFHWILKRNDAEMAKALLEAMEKHGQNGTTAGPPEKCKCDRCWLDTEVLSRGNADFLTDDSEDDKWPKEDTELYEEEDDGRNYLYRLFMPNAPLDKVEEWPFYFGMLSRTTLQTFLPDTGNWCLRRFPSDSTGYSPYAITLRMPSNELMNIVIRQVDDEKTKRHKVYLHRCERFFTAESLGKLIHYILTTTRRLAIGPEPFQIKLTKPAIAPRYFISADWINIPKNPIELGAGNFGKVLLGRALIEGVPQNVAIKLGNVEPYAKSAEYHRVDESLKMRFREERCRVLFEAMVQYSMRHPNVAEGFGIDINSRPFRSVIELCPGGSLLSFLQVHGHELSVMERFHFMLDCARGLKYIHERNLVHRDIAARNCLIGADGLIKIADFGLTLQLGMSSADFNDPEMAIPWLAPECLTYVKLFTLKSDVYAFGMLIFEIWHDGQAPWSHVEDADEVLVLVKSGFKHPMAPTCPAEMVRLFRHCCNRWPSYRPVMGTCVRFIRTIFRKRAIHSTKTQLLPAATKRGVANLYGVKLEPKLAEMLNEEDYFLDEESPPLQCYDYEDMGSDGEHFEEYRSAVEECDALRARKKDWPDRRTKPQQTKSRDNAPRKRHKLNFENVSAETMQFLDLKKRFTANRRFGVAEWNSGRQNTPTLGSSTTRTTTSGTTGSSKQSNRPNSIVQNPNPSPRRKAGASSLRKATNSGMQTLKAKLIPTQPPQSPKSNRAKHIPPK